MPAKLSVNINKIATLRNSRGADTPNLLAMAKDIEAFGAEGITVHPRPDERHIRYADVYELKKQVTTEFNIEGNPKVDSFVKLVMDNLPTQVTLVPDADGQLTSDHGWDTITHATYLKNIVAEFKSKGIRVSLFVDAKEEMIKAAADTGTDRIELYTEQYAHLYSTNPEEAIAPYRECAALAASLGLGVNAGHDLNLQNLSFFAKQIPSLLEVSIGHALISDALYLGIQNTVQMYKKCLQ
jgi:pyridoxine 5-phosphate synthase